MADLEIRTNHVTVKNGDLNIAAYLAQPTQGGPYPGVVVIQEIFGVNSHIRDVTDRIAGLGYVAIAPAIYQRLAPGFEVGYTDADLQLGRKYKEQTTAPELLSDIQATIDFLKQQDNVKNAPFGAIGFCFGGHVTYLAATLPDLGAIASFYGAGIVTGTPGGGPATVTRTPEIKGTLYGFFGTEDPLIPNSEVDQIEAELQKYKIPHRIFRYQATHGFFCDQRDSYNKDAAEDAWKQVRELFAQELTGS
ncbi:dienelactone hydrolase family protein [Limnospira fusiformis KN01]|uniref:Carboxymethylenebutenolidase n=1 Tax=Limnospira maxima CS-328 TaxID=513049 RepID=B5VV08_LIMMA|nr:MULTISPECIES: dienelactone hydrolase family protein [Limnospira]MDC0837430.1 dienelactone hydrolase family protein [Limnoraphis robusta]EDZ96853.1 Carboxymethylenebutenolidase [Limnospira maxima CS-328]MDT9187612.1 dienelactone hydrolase family protein [Limnospira sp. PMC 894.15]QNH59014.1 MAG: dienelactone hydrolase family protein [Limnospira indica BM01]ULB44100.1 dienelactone hydrolase family protein [Limnospira fusiformis KN01]